MDRKVNGILSLAPIAWTGACSSSDDNGLDGDAVGEGGISPKRLTYWQDIVPIVEQKCMGCHQPGGIAPLSMGSYAEMKPWAPAIAAAVSGGIMPPYYI